MRTRKIQQFSTFKVRLKYDSNFRGFPYSNIQFLRLVFKPVAQPHLVIILSQSCQISSLPGLACSYRSRSVTAQSSVDHPDSRYISFTFSTVRSRVKTLEIDTQLNSGQLNSYAKSHLAIFTQVRNVNNVFFYFFSVLNLISPQRQMFYHKLRKELCRFDSQITSGFP